MDDRSQRIASLLEPYMLVAAGLTVPMVAIQASHPGGSLEAVATVLNWTTWLAFVVEVVVMLSVVPDRRRWLREHPLDWIVVVLTPPVLPPGLQSLRVLRLLRLVRLLRLGPLSRRLFSLQGLHYAAGLAVVVIVAGGAAFVALEDSQDLNTWDGIYWAISTMTTLGSTVHPSTTGAEILSVAILLVGISFVALLTGAIAQRFLGPQIAEVEAELDEAESTEAVALRQLREVRVQLEGLQVAVEELVGDPARSTASSSKRASGSSSESPSSSRRRPSR
jgi:voltage-gated potassium channel